MPTTNNGYGIRLKACFRIALTKADNIYISPEHSFHRSDLGYSVTTHSCVVKQNQEHSTETDYAKLESVFIKKL
jgi:hypothetical protein